MICRRPVVRQQADLVEVSVAECVPVLVSVAAMAGLRARADP